MTAGDYNPKVYPVLSFSEEDWAWFEQRRDALGIPVLDGFRLQAEALYSHLTGVNEWTNLTRLRSARDFLKQHLLDSLTCLLVKDVQNLSPDFPCVDLGSGGGYPGLPLACYKPDVPWTLVDSRGKKVKFLQAACTLTGNEQADAQQFRGREAAVMAPSLHQCCQLVVCRATGQSDLMLQECAPMIM
ncbi:MAG: class I SAM-dependent methyltransferase, partial [Planctomycetes bacterium]|nr:class I SAM-dependent methyltransferase [Planctomycetota bacterium]